MPVDEFDHWRAFDRLDPIGSHRVDINFAQLCALIANIKRPVDSRVYGFDDFMLYQRSFIEPVMPNDQIAANLSLIFPTQ